MSPARFGAKFARLLDIYRKPDGSRWSLKEIEDYTGGFVTGRYLTNLKAGRIQQPGLDRMREIARVLGFPVQLWLQDIENWESITKQKESQERGSTLPDRLNLLFDVLVNRRTGKPYTNEQVADFSKGRLTAEDLARARAGEINDFKGAQYLALSDVFGVNPSYWYSAAEQRPTLDRETVEALKNRKTHLILNKISGKSDREKDILLTLLEQLELLQTQDSDEKSQRTADN